MLFNDQDYPTFTGSPDIEAPLKDRFGLKVEGESMNMLFRHGTILECVTYWGDKPIASGSPVIVQRSNHDGSYETTVKEYVIDTEGRQWLVPRSSDPEFQAPIRLGVENGKVDEVRIIALVVASIQRWGT